MINYLCNKKVFATIEEANGYANDIMRKTQYVLCVEKTKRKVTHVYNK